MLYQKETYRFDNFIERNSTSYLYNEEHNFFSEYTSKLATNLKKLNWEKLLELSNHLFQAWKKNRTIYICGNGGSAGNANHIANDLLYAVCEQTGLGLNVISLSSNPSVITCLANDVGYESVYSEQLAVHAQKDDVLVVLSGSGNSKNITEAIQTAKNKKMLTIAIVGFDGGKCKEIADLCIHCKTNDMQIAEDLQLSIGHMIMQWLKVKIKAEIKA